MGGCQNQSVTDEPSKEIPSAWGNGHIKGWMNCKLIVGVRVALDFYKGFGWGLAVQGECSPCLTGCESISLQDIL